MAVEKQLAIKAGIEVDPAIERAADRAFTPWQTKAREVGRAIKNEFEGAARDILRVVTVANAISFGSAMADARKYRDELGRLSIPAGPFGQLRFQIEAISRQHLIPEREIMAAQRGIGRITYDFKGALDAVGALNDEALQTGESLGDKLPLGVTLMQGLGVAGAGVGKELQRVRALAEDLGTPGGATALEDTLGNVKDLLSQISTKTDEDRAKLEALTAGVGKGFSPAAAQRVAQRLLGDVASDPRGYERFLGMKRGSLLDEQGHVKDPLAVLEATRNRILKQSGGDVNKARFLAQGTYGYEGAAALFSADFGAMRKAAASGRLSQVVPQGAAAFAASEAGQAAKRQTEQERTARQTAETLLPAADAAQSLLAAHPIAGTLGLNVGGNLAAKGLGAGFDKVTQLLFGGGKAIEGGGTAAGKAMAAGGAAAGASMRTGGMGGAGGGVGAFGKIAGVGMALAGGYMLGSALDESLGLSDKISGGGHDQFAARGATENQEMAAAEKKHNADKLRRQSAALLIAMRQSSSPEAYAKALGPGLQRDIAASPELQRVQQGAIAGKINTVGLDPESVQAIVDALKQADLTANVTVQTDPDNPIVANAAQHGKSSRN